MKGDQNFDDELIDVSGVHDRANPDLQRIFKEKLSDDGHELNDPCAPPPPKAAIFHQDDSNPYAAKDKWGHQACDPSENRIDPKYHYELPYKSNDPYRSWWKWVNHPVGIVLTATVIFGCVLVFGFVPWLIGVLIAIFIAPYWIIRRSRYQRYYNMDWEADAEPTGCFFQWYRWWRIWW